MHKNRPANRPIAALCGLVLTLLVSSATDLGAASSRPSGLPWTSGAGFCDAWRTIGAWRGRPLDILVNWQAVGGWKEFEMGEWGSRYAQLAAFPGKTSVGFLMLPQSERDNPLKFAKCTAGEYDHHVRNFARSIKKAGLRPTYLRIWEMDFTANGGTIGTNGVLRESMVGGFKSCFRREVTILRQELPGILVDWTSAAYLREFDIRKAYPGDAYVDVIGVNLYDAWPSTPTLATWNARSQSRTRFGGPRGLDTWLEFAKATNLPQFGKTKPKKLSISEWGVWDVPGVGFDNPFYIGKMFEWFTKNAKDIEYEAYFNCSTRHHIYPTGDNPLSSAKYRQLYSTWR